MPSYSAAPSSAGADLESTAETLGKDLQHIREEVRNWSQTMSGIDGFTFDVPNISPGYEKIIDGFKESLERARAVGNLDTVKVELFSKQGRSTLMWLAVKHQYLPVQVQHYKEAQLSSGLW